ncbi:ArpU family transcriptional regulator [Enterococcus sp. BWB1-3]|uniref:ArpU family phage packaging/lysis transcriptional regulator n=1 Tax=Enterococcus sp. BWB1-3 TaxID=2787713 RepID=UPI001923BF75|nr:ArpU family phage packaging/lysis transcriptional regulator [Enterococcus sp. BWB1-3]MBL1229955.1 ArpU family transcriptional regulator [Enterococcus sp. BWB1-3]
MLIFPEIDKKKTKQNARLTLRTFSQLSRLARTEKLPKVTASYYFDLGEDEKNHKEEQVVERKILAEVELKQIASAINKLSAFERRLIYDKYINNKETNVALSLNYHISESKFYRELDGALLHFAESYDEGQLVKVKQGSSGSKVKV